MTEDDAALYVYGIVAASDPAGISATGVKGSAVRTVEHGDIAALVSEIEGGTRAAAREVRAHWRIVDEFPLTASGKIQKFVLRDQLLNG